MAAQTELFSDAGTQMKDVEFMSAKEKQKVLRHWRQFLQSGLSKDKFTKDLYHHLTLHCSFIAHYDLHGFYSTYFEEGDDMVRFLSQFDNRNGIPKSVEYGMTYWQTGSDYSDINSAMCQIGSLYIPALVDEARQKQTQLDVLRAKALLSKHGISIDIERR